MTFIVLNLSDLSANIYPLLLTGPRSSFICRVWGYLGNRPWGAPIWPQPSQMLALAANRTFKTVPMGIPLSKSHPNQKHPSTLLI